jgi:hypothetical protein
MYGFLSVWLFDFSDAAAMSVSSSSVTAPTDEDSPSKI